MLLREFVQAHYRMAPHCKIDGRAMARAWDNWAAPHGIEPRPIARFYEDLRHFGFVVRRGQANKTQVFGIALIDDLPGGHAELVELEEEWTNLPTSIPRDRSGPVLTLGPSARDPFTIKQEIIETIVAEVLDIALSAGDPRVRLQASAMLLDRGFARLAPRPVEKEEPEEEVVEVVEVKDHLSLDEVEAVLRSRIAAAG